MSPMASQQSNTKGYVTCGLSEPWTLHQFKSLQARSLYENDAEHVPANWISRQQNLCITVTSFPTHTQRKKLKFSETALSLAVKLKLPTLVYIFLCKIMAGTVHPPCVCPLWDQWGLFLMVTRILKMVLGRDKKPYSNITETLCDAYITPKNFAHLGALLL